MLIQPEQVVAVAMHGGSLMGNLRRAGKKGLSRKRLMALALALRLVKAGGPLPGKLALFAPWLDLGLADRAIDAVIVATPSETHAPIALAALASYLLVLLVCKAHPMYLKNLVKVKLFL